MPVLLIFLSSVRRGKKEAPADRQEGRWAPGPGHRTCNALGPCWGFGMEPRKHSL